MFKMKNERKKEERKKGSPNYLELLSVEPLNREELVSYI